MGWGRIQHSEQICRGIRQISTAVHGGILVSPTLNRLIPEYMRDPTGAYEEDEAWCIPAVVFANEFEAFWLQHGRDPAVGRSCALRQFRSGYPDAYERFTGQPVKLGESRVKDERELRAYLANEFVVYSACGSWHEGVPPGMVGLYARRDSDKAEIQVLASAEEYNSRFLDGEYYPAANVAWGVATAFVCSLDIHAIWRTS